MLTALILEMVGIGIWIYSHRVGEKENRTAGAVAIVCLFLAMSLWVFAGAFIVAVICAILVLWWSYVWFAPKDD